MRKGVMEKLMDGAVDNPGQPRCSVAPRLPHRPPTSLPTTRCLEEQQQIFKMAFCAPPLEKVKISGR
jgi:hypothetical protein